MPQPAHSLEKVLPEFLPVDALCLHDFGWFVCFWVFCLGNVLGCNLGHLATLVLIPNDVYMRAQMTKLSIFVVFVIEKTRKVKRIVQDLTLR